MTITELEPLEADVISTHGKRVTIRCPYPRCGKKHTHSVQQYGPQRFAPACGMYRSAAARAAGYTFTATQPVRLPNRARTSRKD